MRDPRSPAGTQPDAPVEEYSDQERGECGSQPGQNAERDRAGGRLVLAHAQGCPNQDHDQREQGQPDGQTLRPPDQKE